MKKEDLAKMLDGRQYIDEITPDIQHALQESDLVIVFGASDDLVEFRGFIVHEGNAWEGTTVYLDVETQKILERCEDEDCPFYDKIKKVSPFIEVIWHDTGEYAWTYKTKIPHASFDIMEDGERYCRGIVFSWGDVDLVTCQEHSKEKLLGEALHGVLVTSGVLSPFSTPTGPELLSAAAEYMEAAAKAERKG